MTMIVLMDVSSHFPSLVSLASVASLAGQEIRIYGE